MSLEAVAKAGSFKNFDKDQVIFQEGDPGSEMYIILSGEAQIYLTKEDYLLVLAEFGPGCFFGGDVPVGKRAS